MVLGLLRFTNALGGTSDFIYPGPTTDMQSPASAGAADGTTYLYYAQSFDMSQWEIGTGAYTAASKTFARTSISANSLGTTAKVNFSTAPQVMVFDTFSEFATTGSVSGLIPSGTVMLFWQGAAPTGWTQITTQNDKALRVVSGTGGVAGGTNAFSTVMAQTVVGSHALTTAEMPVHNHGVNDSGHAHTMDAANSSATASNDLAHPANSFPLFSGTATSTVGTGISIQNAGSGAAHNHAITMSIQYIDIILASKN